MKMFPVEFELTLEDETTLLGKFTAFDEESFEVDIKKQIISSDDFRDIADALDTAERLLKDGIKIK